MNEASPTCSPETLPDSLNATSSPGSEDGPTQLDLLDGPMAENSGRARAHANPSARQATSAARKTSATCGPTSTASSPHDGPLSSWESRLRQRLDSIGSTECVLTWRRAITPCARPYSRLVPSMRPTAEIAFGLWPTMTSNAPPRNGNNEAGNSAGQVAIRKIMLGLWSTLRASDGAKGGPNQSFGAGGCPLPSQVFAVGSSSNAPTEGGVGSLHPEFGGWELGFPPEWDACAPLETRSTRASARKS